MFRSFGIKKFYYYKDPNFFGRCIYLIKSIFIIKKIHNIKDFCKIKIDGLDLGLTTYDTYVRYTGNPSPNLIKTKMIIFFSEALYANDYFQKLYSIKNITKLVQAERQFVPIYISYQKALKLNKTIYSRLGTDTITVRIYNNFDQRYEAKNKYSLNLLNLVKKNYKSKSLKIIDQYYKIQFKFKLFGNAWSHFVQLKKEIIEKWKNTNDPHFKQADKNKVFIWPYTRRLVVIVCSYGGT